MPSEIVKKCAAILADRGLNIFFVESATAGRMCSEFALTSQSGDILRGGLSCYEVFVKEQILQVPHKLIEEHTPESREVTLALAKKAAPLFNAKITVAVTGLTTPGGSETKEKPVGTMFFCIATPWGVTECREVFDGDPEQIIMKSVDYAATAIIESLK